MNTTALTILMFVLFSAFWVFGDFAVSGFWGSFFERNEKTKKKDKIQNETTKKERRPQDANNKTTASCF